VNLDFLLEPWRSPASAWMTLAAAFTAIACGLPGGFLVLRRMALTGDAISHSVLPGIVIGFLIAGSLDSPWLIAGAAASGWLTVMIIELLSRRGGVREDAATGIVFTAMFSLGVLLLKLYASRVDLDPDCILFGNLETAIHGKRSTFGGYPIPRILITTAGAAFTGIAFVSLFFHRLVATSFDPSLSRLSGLSPALVQSLLLAVVAAVVVAAFQVVGAIMTIALLVLPAASALLVVKRLPHFLAAIVIHALLSAVFGLYLATWLNCNFGAAVVIAGALLFCACLAAAARRRVEELA
jgi:manganese/zinc/iron transport system permease protein